MDEKQHTDESPAEAVAPAAEASAGATVSDKKQDESKLDLAFAMDCTGSMGSYISEAQRNIRKIVEDIVAAEKAQVRLALVKYRDHPPQDSSFVTDTHDFTTSVREMKGWLDACSASGGGDDPEAVADALHQVLKLNWRQEAVKICVLIADAPPHGLSPAGDGFPNGCPNGLDPMEITHRLAEKGVVLYMVGCEPSILRYKDFFMSLNHLTGGQYVPLGKASVLAKVVIGGAQEEISLQKLMEEVNQEVINEYAMQGAENVDAELLSRRVHENLKCKGARSNQLRMNDCFLPSANMNALKMAKAETMDSARAMYSTSSHYDDYALDISAGALPKAKKKSRGLFGRKAPRAAADSSDLLFECAEPGACMAPMPMTGSDDVYEVAEDEIQIEQARRMVQRSVMSNCLYTKKS